MNKNSAIPESNPKVDQVMLLMRQKLLPLKDVNAVLDKLITEEITDKSLRSRLHGLSPLEKFTRLFKWAGDDKKKKKKIEDPMDDWFSLLPENQAKKSKKPKVQPSDLSNFQWPPDYLKVESLGDGYGGNNEPHDN